MFGMTPLPDGHKVVGICVFQEKLMVATDKGVFAMVDGVLTPVQFAAVPVCKHDYLYIADWPGWRCEKCGFAVKKAPAMEKE
jgi:hypothetical protein